MATTFKDHIIALCGTFPMHKQAVLIDKIESGGGIYSARVLDDCTHLVTTQKDVDDNKPKCKKAAALKSVKIVSWNWLLDSAADGKPASEASYLLTATPAPAPAPAITNGRPPRSSRTKQQSNGTTTNVSLDDDENDAPAANAAPSKDKKSAASSKAKRPIAADDDDEDATASKSQDEPPAKKKKNAKIAPPILKVPVDEFSPYVSSYEVFIENGVIYDAALNQTNSSNNNNKFYLIQLLVHKTSGTYATWMRWGRVGEIGQKSSSAGQSLDRARDMFEKKFSSKTGLSWKNRLNSPKASKYTYIERNYEEDSEDEGKSDKKAKKEVEEDVKDVKTPECTLSQPVQDFVKLIFNQRHMLSTMASMSYDANKLPLGKLSKRTLMAGFEVLKSLSELVANPSLAVQNHGMPFGQAAEYLSNQYFTLIPHVFGRRRPPVIGSLDLIKREVELIETLTDMEIANEILKDAKASETGLHFLDVQFSGLGLSEMAPLDSATIEYKELEDYLVKSHGKTHYISYKLKHIFRVERNGEKERFENSSFANLPNSNRRLLWHGSRSTNYGGILSQGLRIAPPEAPVTGYMFGKGVYFADISSKSANYCCSRSSDNIGVLMLCDVELGNPMLELVDSDYHAGENAKKQGSLSTLGKGKTVPKGWKDAACVHEDLKGAIMPDVSSPPEELEKTDAWLQYNEYIVYDVAQIRVKYLLYVEMN
ncbi:poly [ADP-ribose] polymerase [Blastomyces parvus]|uniref:Poly [ADP-ribose] polymerase n=1 Tax=Blastomyces parvus TaxID=2060905 RepID=A0A2B7X2K2_9EURO|nr:poly [ADP-ribose] polymerase [Blastomyces parvus]